MPHRKLLTGNEALALGALHAGARVITGYPGTPSTGAIESLLALSPPGVHVEWSTNEKVALEIAAGAAWVGQRALCTMKMSGLNVASDSLYSIAYSGVVGGLVVYVADDPGVSAGMCEQDSRGFALLADLPLIDPPSVAEAYRLTRLAFDLSEEVGTPVLVRLTTAVAHSSAPMEVGEGEPPPAREPQLIRDIARFTKAGAAICMQQHRDLIARLEEAGRWLRRAGLNELRLAPRRGGLGIIAGGVVNAYLEEGLAIATRFGLDPETVSVLAVRAPHPFPAEEARALLEHGETVLVLEELGRLRGGAAPGVPGPDCRETGRDARPGGRLRRGPCRAGDRRGGRTLPPARPLRPLYRRRNAGGAPSHHRLPWLSPPGDVPGDQPGDPPPALQTGRSGGDRRHRLYHPGDEPAL